MWTHKTCCKYPKIQTVLFCYRVIGPKDAARMSKSVDPDQTAPFCSDLSVRKLWIITVERSHKVQHTKNVKLSMFVKLQSA